MRPENPWLDAVVESFPADAPQNAARLDLLVEAATAIPFSSKEPDPFPPSPPWKAAWRSLLASCVILLTVLGLHFVSPPALDRLRTFALADQLNVVKSNTTSLSEPLRSIHPAHLDNRWSPASWYPLLESRIPPSHRPYVLGDPSELSLIDRWQTSWQTRPNSPATAAETLRIDLTDDGSILPEKVAELKALDPGNGYYDLAVACLLLTESTAPSGRRPSGYPQVSISNPANFQRAEKFLDRAIAADFIADRRDERLISRLSLCRPAEDFGAFVLNRAVYFDLRQLPSGSIASGDSVACFFIPSAEEMVAQQNPEGLRQLCEQWTRIAKHLSAMDPTGAMVAFAWNSAPAMEAACRSLRLTSWEDHFRLGMAAVRPELPPSITTYDFSVSSFSQFSSLGTDSLRLAEHRYYEKLDLIFAAAFSLVLVLVVSLLSLSSSSRLLGLPGRLAHALRPIDHLRILIFGALVPSVLVASILENPFLYSRETTYTARHALSVTLLFSGLIICVLFHTTREISISLARRASPIGFRRLHPRLYGVAGWMALLIAPATMALDHLSGLPLPFVPDKSLRLHLFGLLGLLLMAYFAETLLLLYSGHRRLHAATLLRVLILHLAILAGIFSAWAGVDGLIERHHMMRSSIEDITSPPFQRQLRGSTPDARIFQKALENHLFHHPES
ncbi:hypothetical protein HNR46_003599 [Haloferula luteola]|uniref:Uncharacterized protein n=1 Tax=Haloferula luteola TaxID=595692 RepID=A0A840V6Q0_9BACT|nr:hypothetical protein [Haloferula luteola]MBB5353343.1 hypothetical protein [Haloferula luteola]